MKGQRSTRFAFLVLLLTIALSMTVPGAFADETGIDDARLNVEFEVDFDQERELDNDALFDAYVRNLFDLGETRIFSKGYVSSNLTGTNKLLYEALKPEIEKIASGERTDTRITLTVDESTAVKTDWTAEELGLDTVRSGTSSYATYEAKSAALDIFWDSIDTQVILNALIANCPYELYWMHPTSPFSFSMSGNYSLFLRPGNEFAVSIAGSEVTFSFNVAPNYGSDYTLKNADIQRAHNAIENARAILNRYASSSDYDKLLGYCREVAASDYNHDAADLDFEGYGSSDPWQLVWVFDGDPTTTIVCEGFSKAFQYLCDQTRFDSNIRCISVTGEMISRDGSGGHMWNIVRMPDGYNYMMDVTNCDPDGLRYLFMDGYTSGSVSEGYTYRMITKDVSYVYYQDTRAYYQEADLTMSPNKYDPSSYVPPTPAEYTVAYDANGGSNAPENQTKTEGERLTLSNVIPTHSDTGAGSYTVTLDPNEGSVTPDKLTAAIATSYTFMGWNTASDGTGMSYEAGAEYTADADATLFAQWDANTTIASVMLPTPERKGYSFKGWNTDRSAVSGVTGSYSPTRNVTLYALWEEDVNYEQWGDLRWQLDDGRLTISGSGAMNGFEEESDLAWRQYADEIRSVTIESGVTSIGTCAFYGCGALTQITLPNTLTAIGSGAFFNCAALTDITIPGSVTKLGTHVFRGCEALQEINIPNSVKSIGKYTFAYCNSVTHFTIPASIEAIPEGLFAFCEKVTDITLTNGLKTIGVGAFYGCPRLSQVTIPNSVIAIGDEAFTECVALTSLDLPDSINAIGEYAFRGCTGLTEVTMPAGITVIEKGVFCNCDSLENVTIPYGIQSIGPGAFVNCGSLTEISIPASVTELDDEAFRGCVALKRLVLPDSVTSIGDSAFYDCSSLTSLSLPRYLTMIDGWTFRGCTGLHEIIIPDHVTSIGDKAFLLCSNLESITIPASVTSIGEGAFYLCDSLTDVHYSGTESQWDAITVGQNNAALTSAAFHFDGQSQMDPDDYDVIIPYGVTRIEEGSFEGARFQSVFIPETVRYIGSRAFANNWKLTRICFESGNITIEDDFLSGCAEGLIIIAPAGSTVANNESTYRSYLYHCDPPPEIVKDHDSLIDRVRLPREQNGNN